MGRERRAKARLGPAAPPPPKGGCGAARRVYTVGLTPSPRHGEDPPCFGPFPGARLKRALIDGYDKSPSCENRPQRIGLREFPGRNIQRRLAELVTFVVTVTDRKTGQKSCPIRGSVVASEPPPRCHQSGESDWGGISALSKAEAVPEPGARPLLPTPAEPEREEERRFRSRENEKSDPPGPTIPRSPPHSWGFEEDGHGGFCKVFGSL